jgi:hypothetical protein
LDIHREDLGTVRRDQQLRAASSCEKADAISWGPILIMAPSYEGIGYIDKAIEVAISRCSSPTLTRRLPGLLERLLEAIVGSHDRAGGGAQSLDGQVLRRLGHDREYLG